MLHVCQTRDTNGSAWYFFLRVEVNARIAIFNSYRISEIIITNAWLKHLLYAVISKYITYYYYCNIILLLVITASHSTLIAYGNRSKIKYD